MLGEVFLSGISVFSVDVMSVDTPGTIMLNVIIQSVILLNVEAPIAWLTMTIKIAKFIACLICYNHLGCLLQNFVLQS